MATAGIVASIAGVVASLLPVSLVRRLWPGWTWVVPAVVMVTFAYLLRNFFLR